MSNIDMNKNSENGSSNYTGDDKFVIKNLNLHYGDFHALKNINMNIPKNQITAFIGPSGCGKSTFLKTLNRMNDLIEGVKIDGEVYLDGANIFTEMDDITLRHRVGMVFQQPNPFPKSIYDNIAYGPRLFGVHKKAELDIIVEKALKQAAIWDEVKDRLKKLLDFQVDSSRDYVLQELLQLNQRLFLWMSRHQPLTQYQLQELKTLRLS